MTREEIEALEGVALAEAVALEIMGWHRGAPGTGTWYSSGDPAPYYIRDGGYVGWRPDRDWNHAAEVMAKMCELHGGYWEVASSFGKTVQEARIFYHGKGRDSGWGMFGQNELITVCRVALCAASELERPA